MECSLGPSVGVVNLRRSIYLDDEGNAIGPWAGGLDNDKLRAGLRAMLKTRAYDARMMIMQRQRQTSFYMQCTGEEAVACAGGWGSSSTKTR